jgi:microcystin-dependent protein
LVREQVDSANQGTVSLWKGTGASPTAGVTTITTNPSIGTVSLVRAHYFDVVNADDVGNVQIGIIAAGVGAFSFQTAMTYLETTSGLFTMANLGQNFAASMTPVGTTAIPGTGGAQGVTDEFSRFQVWRTTFDATRPANPGYTWTEAHYFFSALFVELLSSGTTPTFTDSAGTLIPSAVAFSELTAIPAVLTEYVAQTVVAATDYLELQMQNHPVPNTGIWSVRAIAALSGSSAAGTSTGTVRVVSSTGVTLVDVYTGSFATTAIHYKAAIVTPPSGGWDSGFDGARVRFGFADDVTPNPRLLSVMFEYLVAGAAEVPKSDTDARPPATDTQVVAIAQSSSDGAGGASAAQPDYFEGFEHRVISELQFGGTSTGIVDALQNVPAMSFVAGRLSGYALHIVEDGVLAPFWRVNLPSATLRQVSLYFRIPPVTALAQPNPTVDSAFFGLRSSTGTTLVTFDVRASDGVIRNQVGTGSRTLGPSVNDNAWHKLDILLDTTGTTWTCQWYVDDIVKPTASITGQAAGTGIVRMSYGSNSNAHTLTVDVDDVVTSLDLTDYPYLPHRVVLSVPNTDLPHNGGTNTIEIDDGSDVNNTGSGNAHQQLAEWPPDLTTYVQQSAAGAGNYAALAFEDATLDNILAVKAIAAMFSAGTPANDGTTEVLNSANTLLMTLYSGDMSTDVLHYRTGIVPQPVGGWDPAFAGIRMRIGFSADVVPQPRWSALAFAYLVIVPAAQESENIQLAVAGSDSGAGANAQTLATAIPGTDTGTRTETEADARASSSTDSGTGNEPVTGQTNTQSDSATATESQVISQGGATTTDSDIGHATDAYTIARPVSDSGTGSNNESINAPSPALATQVTSVPGTDRSYPGNISPAFPYEDETPIVEPPPPAVQDAGLVHYFVGPGGERSLPANALGVHARLGNFQDNVDMAGGYIQASGVISEDEYNTNPTIYTTGAWWYVQNAYTNEYVFAGRLREPVAGPGQYALIADGAGKLSDSQVERFLVMSYSYDLWAQADVEPFTILESPPNKPNPSNPVQGYTNWKRLQLDILGDSIRWLIPKHTSFKRNHAGNPARWESMAVCWTPLTDLRYVAGDIVKYKDDNHYDLELVAMTGPSGSPTVLATYSMGVAGPNSFAEQIPAGYDMIGLRLVRDQTAKRAPMRRFRIKNLHVGSIATSETFTLTNVFEHIFSRLGIAGSSVESSTQSAIPFDTSRVTLAEIADEFSILGPWYWRVWANSSRQLIGEAASFGTRTWRVTETHQPIQLLPDERWNKVAFEYDYGGGQFALKTVTASPNPFPVDYSKTFNMQWPEPPFEDIGTRFAQMVADYLAQLRWTGDATFSQVENPQNPGVPINSSVIRPGDQLVLANNDDVVVTVGSMSHSEGGGYVRTEFTSGNPILDKWLAERQRLLNMGRGPNGATMGLLDPDEPAVAANVGVEFIEAQTRHGHRRFHAYVTWDEVEDDVDGLGTAIRSYHVRMRPVNQAGNPILRANGGGWRKRKVTASRDGSDPTVDEDFQILFKNLENPHKWYWVAQVQAEDVLGQLGDWSTATNPEKPAFAAMATAENITFDMDPNFALVEWDYPEDPDDPNGVHPDIDHVEIQLATDHQFTTGGSGSMLRHDKFVHGQQKRWKFQNPQQGHLYAARLRTHDVYGSTSNWLPDPPGYIEGVPGSSGGGGPLSAPTGVALDFDQVGAQRHRRNRAKVTWDELLAIAGTSHYEVHFAVSTDGGASWDPDTVNRDIPAKRDDDVGTRAKAVFTSGIKKWRFYRARVRVVAFDGQRGPWSAWTPGGTPSDTQAPPPPTSLTFEVDQHRGHVTWTLPPDPEDPTEIHQDVLYSQVQIATNAAFTANVQEDLYRVGTKCTFKVKRPRTNGYRARVRTVDASGNKSNWYPSDTGSTVTLSAPPTPNAPDLSFFIGEGTGKNKIKASVTYTQAAVNAEQAAYAEDDIVAYHLQLQVGSVVGTTPQNSFGPSNKRWDVHRRLSDDQNDDPIEFEHVVRRAYWYRCRGKAIDTQGRASAWSAWSTGQKATVAAAQILPPPTNHVAKAKKTAIQIAFAPPQLDGQNDESVDSFHVQVWTGANGTGSLLEDDDFNRARQINYPADDSWGSVFPRVRTKDHLGNFSAWVPSNPASVTPGVVTAGAGGAEPGDLKVFGGPGLRLNHWNTDFAPAGTTWIRCNGSQQFVNSFPQLFQEIGFQEGGNGSSIFRVPDLKGRPVKGAKDTDVFASQDSLAESQRVDIVGTGPHNQDATNEGGGGHTHSMGANDGASASHNLSTPQGDGQNPTVNGTGAMPVASQFHTHPNSPQFGFTAPRALHGHPHGGPHDNTPGSKGHGDVERPTKRLHWYIKT